MKPAYLILVVFILSCSTNNEQKKWANEPNEIKYSVAREKEVWGHVLHGKDPVLFYGTPLEKAAEAIASGNSDKAQSEISKLSAKHINFQEAKFNIPLNQFAIDYADFKALKALTEMGADPNLASTNTYTAFTMAIMAANSLDDNRYMKYLIANGGDLSYKVREMYTPLMLASSDKLENVRVLVESGADPHYLDPSIENNIVHSPLEIAIKNDKIAITNYYIMELGVAPNTLTHTPKKDKAPWTIIDDVARMDFGEPRDSKKEEMKQELLLYLQEQGFKNRVKD